MNVYIGTSGELKNAYIGEYVPPQLCFTANTAGSTVKLDSYGSPTSVNLETSTDGKNWSDYTIKSTITLSNIGDKIYFRNKSTTTTGFSLAGTNYYQFVMSGSINASGDINYLLNKNSTDTVSDYCFAQLFKQCSALRTAPELPATKLGTYCYSNMFRECSNLTEASSLPATTLKDHCYYYMFYYCLSLTELPSLPALTLTTYCYYYMFYYCRSIKLSTTQTGEYQTPYRIPTTGTGTTANYALYYMFDSTGGTFAGTPSINTTYYTSNTVV